MSTNHPIRCAALKIVEGRLNDQSIPPSAQNNLKQHYENLTHLAEDLKKLGMGDQQIDDHIIEIFKEYERELTDNIRRISNTQQKPPIRDAS